MHEPTCVFWANLTPFSLEPADVLCSFCYRIDMKHTPPDPCTTPATAAPDELFEGGGGGGGGGGGDGVDLAFYITVAVAMAAMGGTAIFRCRCLSLTVIPSRSAHSSCCDCCRFHSS
jgi:hypothetical protein